MYADCGKLLISFSIFFAGCRAFAAGVGGKKFVAGIGDSLLVLFSLHVTGNMGSAGLLDMP